MWDLLKDLQQKKNDKKQADALRKIKKTMRRADTFNGFFSLAIISTYFYEVKKRMFILSLSYLYKMTQLLANLVTKAHQQ